MPTWIRIDIVAPWDAGSRIHPRNAPRKSSRKAQTRACWTNWMGCQVGFDRNPTLSCAFPRRTTNYNSTYFPQLPRRDEQRVGSGQERRSVIFRSRPEHGGDDVAHQCRPSSGFWQLWRSSQNHVQALAYVGDQSLDLIAGGMGQGEQQTRLTGMLGQARHPRVRRSRFFGQSDKLRPTGRKERETWA